MAALSTLAVILLNMSAYFEIPNAGRIRQLNDGDGKGEIFESFNIDLHTKPGKILLARPLVRIAQASDIGTDAVEALAFADLALSGDSVYAVTETALFSAPGPDYDNFGLETNN